MSLCKKCKYKEVGKGLDNVKGYILIEECSDCREKRELEQIKIIEEENKRIKIQEAEDLIQSKIREIAIASLVADNKIVKEDGDYIVNRNERS